MKKLILLAAFSLFMIVTAVGSVTGQSAPKEVKHDFIYGTTYTPKDTVIFAENDSLVVGEIIMLKGDLEGESQIQLSVKYGDKTSYFFIFVFDKKLRVAQEKIYEEGKEQPTENVVYFPLGKGKLRMLNYNTSVEMTNAQKKEHFGMVVAFVEEKFGIKIRY